MIESTTRLSNIAQRYDAGMQYPELLIPCHRANSDGQCWPSEKGIAKALSMSLSTVKRAISGLRKHGYIETEQRYRTKGGNSTLQFRIKSYPINTKG